jgi:hypothetical protein
MVNVWKVSTVALAVALGVSVGGGAIRTANADPQPRMEDALTKLQDAKGWLERAADDKGGHRAKAIGLTAQAIEETRQGIKFANEHH